jgi:hypothetical protein
MPNVTPQQVCTKSGSNSAVRKAEPYGVPYDVKERNGTNMHSTMMWFFVEHGLIMLNCTAQDCVENRYYKYCNCYTVCRSELCMLQARACFSLLNLVRPAQKCLRLSYNASLQCVAHAHHQVLVLASPYALHAGQWQPLKG